MNNFLKCCVAVLRRCHQWYWQRKRLALMACTVRVLRRRYERQFRRVSAKYGKEKLRVIFPVSNAAKWKMQGLFDLMAASDKFEPLFILTAMDTENDASNPDAAEKQFLALREMCEKRKMPYDVAYDTMRKKFKPFSVYHPDIVWYQVPWRIDRSQSPETVSRYALTCYVPYFVQNYGGLDLDCEQPFHRYLWRHFTLSQKWAGTFMEDQGSMRAGESVGCGHPMLDAFSDRKSSSEDGYVIYAPHWSCNVAECYSTFHIVGRFMLEFAKKHPEIKWVFKPHPTLRRTLLFEKIMTPQEVDAYYDEWGKLGMVCYGDYVELFLRSKAMITDCASFLMEYACTGKPIIHLISKNVKYEPHPVSAALFDTYYQVRNMDELKIMLDSVILHDKDDKRDVRLARVREMNLLNSHASRGIIKYIDAVFSGNR